MKFIKNTAVINAMKSLLISFFLLLAYCSSAQEPGSVDSLYFAVRLKSIAPSFTTAIAFREFSYGNINAPWYILVKDSGGNIAKYKTNEYLQLLYKMDRSPEALKKELDLFYRYDIFSLKGAQGWLNTCDSCHSKIFDGLQYSFLVLTKKEFFYLYLYEPGHYVTCCTGLSGYKQAATLVKELEFK